MAAGETPRTIQERPFIASLRHDGTAWCSAPSPREMVIEGMMTVQLSWLSRREIPAVHILRDHILPFWRALELSAGAFPLLGDLTTLHRY